MSEQTENSKPMASDTESKKVGEVFSPNMIATELPNTGESDGNSEEALAQKKEEIKISHSKAQSETDTEEDESGSSVDGFVSIPERQLRLCFEANNLQPDSLDQVQSQVGAHQSGEQHDPATTEIATPNLGRIFHYSLRPEERIQVIRTCLLKAWPDEWFNLSGIGAPLLIIHNIRAIMNLFPIGTTKIYSETISNLLELIAPYDAAMLQWQSQNSQGEATNYFQPPTPLFPPYSQLINLLSTEDREHFLYTCVIRGWKWEQFQENQIPIQKEHLDKFMKEQEDHPARMPTYFRLLNKPRNPLFESVPMYRTNDQGIVERLEMPPRVETSSKLRDEEDEDVLADFIQELKDQIERKNNELMLSKPNSEKEGREQQEEVNLSQHHLAAITSLAKSIKKKTKHMTKEEEDKYNQPRENLKKEQQKSRERCHLPHLQSDHKSPDDPPTPKVYRLTMDMSYIYPQKWDKGLTEDKQNLFSKSFPPPGEDDSSDDEEEDEEQHCRPTVTLHPHANLSTEEEQQIGDRIRKAKENETPEQRSLRLQLKKLYTCLGDSQMPSGYDHPWVAPDWTKSLKGVIRFRNIRYVQLKEAGIYSTDIEIWKAVIDESRKLEKRYGIDKQMAEKLETINVRSLVNDPKEPLPTKPPGWTRSLTGAVENRRIVFNKIKNENPNLALPLLKEKARIAYLKMEKENDIPQHIRNHLALIDEPKSEACRVKQLKHRNQYSQQTRSDIRLKSQGYITQGLNASDETETEESDSDPNWHPYVDAFSTPTRYGIHPEDLEGHDEHGREFGDTIHNGNWLPLPVREKLEKERNEDEAKLKQFISMCHETTMVVCTYCETIHEGPHCFEGSCDQVRAVTNLGGPPQSTKEICTNCWGRHRHVTLDGPGFDNRVECRHCQTTHKPPFCMPGNCTKASPTPFICNMPHSDTIKCLNKSCLLSKDNKNYTENHPPLFKCNKCGGRHMNSKAEKFDPMVNCKMCRTTHKAPKCMSGNCYEIKDIITPLLNTDNQPCKPPKTQYICPTCGRRHVNMKEAGIPNYNRRFKDNVCFRCMQQHPQPYCSTAIECGGYEANPLKIKTATRFICDFCGKRHLLEKSPAKKPIQWQEQMAKNLRELKETKPIFCSVCQSTHSGPRCRLVSGSSSCPFKSNSTLAYSRAPKLFCPACHIRHLNPQILARPPRCSDIGPHQRNWGSNTPFCFQTNSLAEGTVVPGLHMISRNLPYESGLYMPSRHRQPEQTEGADQQNQSQKTLVPEDLSYCDECLCLHTPPSCPQPKQLLHKCPLCLGSHSYPSCRGGTCSKEDPNPSDKQRRHLCSVCLERHIPPHHRFIPDTKSTASKLPDFAITHQLHSKEVLSRQPSGAIAVERSRRIRAVCSAPSVAGPPPKEETKEEVKKDKFVAALPLEQFTHFIFQNQNTVLICSLVFWIILLSLK
jgi:hypothetical protein